MPNYRLAVVLLTVALTAPSAVRAQSLPSIPPDLQNSPILQSVLNAVGGLLQTTNGNAAHGRVAYFRRFDLQLETAPNVFRDIHLHPGTVINPRGASIAAGQTVDVSGIVQPDRSLNADTVTIH